MSSFDDAFNLLASKFPKRYSVKSTKFLQGLLKSIATGDSYIEDQIEATRDNLIAITASGANLDRRAALYGIVRGEGTGVLDPDFQQLIPILGLSPKQISIILLKIIDTFYGPYTSHANITASLSEPYHLNDGDQLLVRLDNTEEIIVFHSGDAVDLHNATSDELATAISQKTNGRIIGATLTDTRTGSNFLNMRTSTIGSQGFISAIGGNAETEIQFPTARNLIGTLATWSVSRYLGTNEMIYTVISGPAPNLSSAQIIRGDSVVVRTDSGFNSKNTGTFQVSAVGSNFFRVINPNGVVQTIVTNIHTNDFFFFDPILGNVLLSARPAALVETSPRQLTVILPVTSPIVKRTIRGGHHFHQGDTEVLLTTTNSITVGSVTGYPASGAVRLLITRKPSEGIISTTSPTTITLIDGQNWPTQGAIWVANVREFFYYQGIIGNQLQNVTPTPPSQIAGEHASYTELYSYTSITGTTLNGVFPDPSALIGQTVFAAGAITGTNFPGSFLYDKTATFTPASELARTQEDIKQGSVRTLVQVDNVASFPATGEIVVEFGTDQQEGPIKYLAKVGTTGLILDPSHIFALDHISGIGLRLVGQIGAYTPRVNGQDLAVYTTSTSPARDLLTSYLASTVASGIQTRYIIQVPGQKWPVLPNLYTSDPLATTLV
jgi:hypothetical protein